MICKPETIIDKIWRSHEIKQFDDGSSLLWVDRHLINEGTSVQAFAELEARGVNVERPGMNLAVADHLLPTNDRTAPLPEGRIRDRVEGLATNCARHGIPHIPWSSTDQGICHVIAPELGVVLPGMIAVCGDSHTSTLGGLGAFAFGIGTTELAHVLATGTIVARKPLAMSVRLVGQRPFGVTAKDLILTVIGQIGTAGATGYAIEFSGQGVAALQIDERLTLCNMAIEAGARSGLVGPDETTFGYLKGRRFAPAGDCWDQAVACWRALRSDPDCRFDEEVEIDITAIAPLVTWGTSPQDVVAVDGRIPDPEKCSDPARAAAVRRALDYQGLEPDMAMTDIWVDQIFIGSCTNARLSDLREAANVVRGSKLADGVRGFVAPGSTRTKLQAEAEGLDRVFLNAGFEWRDSACSMCGGIETVPPGTRVATTSNRNFENRQGPGVRSHLVSPAMAAAAGIAGHFVDIRSWKPKHA